jgi:3-mercaptopropionate dioxygenase
VTNDQDEYYVEAPVLTRFVAEVQRAIREAEQPEEIVRRLRHPFHALLHDRSWLPAAFRSPDTTGGMGGGIGNYLLYRSATRDLTLMSLVVPPAASTPVHDHLAWGLVGLYEGEQREWVYRRVDDATQYDRAELVEHERRHLRAGEYYELLPPHGDIHRVQTISEGPSVSLHLLGNDVGCTWRHRFDVEQHAVHAFRSSYSNQPCEEAPTAGS